MIFEDSLCRTVGNVSLIFLSHAPFLFPSIMCLPMQLFFYLSPQKWKKQTNLLRVRCDQVSVNHATGLRCEQEGMTDGEREKPPMKTNLVWTASRSILIIWLISRINRVCVTHPRRRRCDGALSDENDRLLSSLHSLNKALTPHSFPHLLKLFPPTRHLISSPSFTGEQRKALLCLYGWNLWDVLNGDAVSSAGAVQAAMSNCYSD